MKLPPSYAKAKANKPKQAEEAIARQKASACDAGRGGPLPNRKLEALLSTPIKSPPSKRTKNCGVSVGPSEESTSPGTEASQDAPSGSSTSGNSMDDHQPNF